MTDWLSVARNSNYIDDEQRFFIVTFKSYGEWRTAGPFATVDFARGHIKDNLTTKTTIMNGQVVILQDKDYIKNICINEVNLKEAIQ